MRFSIFNALAVAIVAVQAAPAVPPVGITFESGARGAMPLLSLPYATYRATMYDTSDDYYVFRNIRFAAPPVGNLRWAKPQPPLKQEGIQDGKTGNQCFQALPGQFFVGTPILEALEPSSEDCLFLDVWVPGKAIRGEVKNLPVLFWIFGGGYALGSKSFFLYDGSPLMRSADMNMIYVAPNYRVGAFGFLNGPSVAAKGTPNAGLHDQRAALKWVQDHIGLVGGDKNQVTAMGESAGAGSIMHHLVAEGGTLNPMFKRAIMQSPAFEPLYDNGRLEKQFQVYALEAGCPGQDLTCLRAASSEALQRANKGTILDSPYGTFGYGPGVDGTFIRDLPSMELAKGNFWKDVSIITGHTSNEGILFSDPLINTNDKIKVLVNTNFPNATEATRAKIVNELYPAPRLFGEFSSHFERLNHMLQEFVVTCNTRFLVEAYKGKSWSYVFSVPPGIHAFDLIFTFFRTDLNIGDFQIDFDFPFISGNNLMTGWQSYFTSFVRAGNPNTHRQVFALPFTKNWPLSDVKSNGISALDVNILGFDVETDTDAGNRCDFWKAGAWAGTR